MEGGVDARSFGEQKNKVMHREKNKIKDSTRKGMAMDNVCLFPSFSFSFFVSV